jgi:hypothetical protein
MINDETDYIEIDSEPFSGVTYEVVDYTTEDIGIGTISIVTATDAAEEDSLITLKYLQGNDTVNVEEVNGDAEEEVNINDIAALE